MATSEKRLEKKLSIEIKKLGGLALKYVPIYNAGMPDRLILVNGRTYWAEIKSSGKKLSRIQEIRRRELDRLGFKVHIIDSEPKLNEFINIVKRGR